MLLVLLAADFFIRKYFASFTIKPFAHNHIYIYMVQGKGGDLSLCCSVVCVGSRSMWGSNLRGEKCETEKVALIELKRSFLFCI